MGLIVGNAVLPDHLKKWTRRNARVLQNTGMDVVALTPEESKYGAVETRKKAGAARIYSAWIVVDGVIVTLPNFGEERAIADTSAPAELRASTDQLLRRSKKMTIAPRQLCGKMSACNNLRQYGIPYSITTLHTKPLTLRFAKDLWSPACAAWWTDSAIFVGALALADRFNTVRYSEKIWSQGISIETLTCPSAGPSNE